MEVQRPQQVKIRVPDHLHQAIRFASVTTGITIQQMGEFGLLWVLARILHHDPNALGSRRESIETMLAAYKESAVSELLDLKDW